MSEKYAWLIKDPTINLKMQHLARLSFSTQSANELWPDEFQYLNFSLSEAINKTKFSTTIYQEKKFISEIKNVFMQRYELIYKETNNNEFSQEAVQRALEIFQNIITKTDFLQNSIEDNISGQSQNDFLR